MNSESDEPTLTFDELVPLQLLQQTPKIGLCFLAAVLMDAEVFVDVNGSVVVEHSDHLME